jgi:hypothetical protein
MAAWQLMAAVVRGKKKDNEDKMREIKSCHRPTSTSPQVGSDKIISTTPTTHPTN